MELLQVFGALCAIVFIIILFVRKEPEADEEDRKSAQLPCGYSRFVQQEFIASLIKGTLDQGSSKELSEHLLECRSCLRLWIESPAHSKHVSAHEG